MSLSLQRRILSFLRPELALSAIVSATYAHSATARARARGLQKHRRVWVRAPRVLGGPRAAAAAHQLHAAAERLKGRAPFSRPASPCINKRGPRECGEFCLSGTGEPSSRIPESGRESPSLSLSLFLRARRVTSNTRCGPLPGSSSRRPSSAAAAASLQPRAPSGNSTETSSSPKRWEHSHTLVHTYIGMRFSLVRSALSLFLSRARRLRTFSWLITPSRLPRCCAIFFASVHLRTHTHTHVYIDGLACVKEYPVWELHFRPFIFSRMFSSSPPSLGCFTFPLRRGATARPEGKLIRATLLVKSLRCYCAFPFIIPTYMAGDFFYCAR